MGPDWIRIDRVTHQWKIVNCRDKYGKQLISRKGNQIIYRHKYDLLGLFAKRMLVTWSDWKVEMEIL